jgi:hypothetical protein
MKGDKCALNYCDFWNDEAQACSLALESHKRVEILTIILAKAAELVADAKEKEDLMKIIRDLNIIEMSKSIN